MKLIKEFLCDGQSPTNDEIERCLKAVKNENCVINLYWMIPPSGMCCILIKDGMSFEDCLNQTAAYIRSSNNVLL